MNPEAKSKKYHQLLAAAADLFYRHGIQRISVEEICREARVSKMTFYRYFRDKLDIARTMLTGMLDQAEADYRAIMESDEPYDRKVKNIIRFKLESTENMGTAFVQEFLDSPYPELRKLIKEWTERTLSTVRRDFVKAQEEGHIRRDIRPEFLILLINKMRQWSTDPDLTRLYPSTQELAREMVNLFFYGILHPENNED